MYVAVQHHPAILRHGDARFVEAGCAYVLEPGGCQRYINHRRSPTIDRNIELAPMVSRHRRDGGRRRPRAARRRQRHARPPSTATTPTSLRPTRQSVRPRRQPDADRHHRHRVHLSRPAGGRVRPATVGASIELLRACSTPRRSTAPMRPTRRRCRRSTAPPQTAAEIIAGEHDRLAGPGDHQRDQRRVVRPRTRTKFGYHRRLPGGRPRVRAARRRPISATCPPTPTASSRGQALGGRSPFLVSLKNGGGIRASIGYDRRGRRQGRRRAGAVATSRSSTSRTRCASTTS